jgi:hypothetical protein
MFTWWCTDRDPTLPSAQFVWQPCGSYIFGCCLGVSLHWSCIMILWMWKAIPIFSIYMSGHTACCQLPNSWMLRCHPALCQPYLQPTIRNWWN